MADKNLRPDWSEDKLAVCIPENFRVEIGYDRQALGLSLEDEKRLLWKLELVEKLAAKLAANMAKGCLKYRVTSDDMPVDEWLNYLGDDAVDVCNYIMLLQRRRKRDQETQTEAGS